MAVLHVFVIPAKVGIHFWAQATWIPAFAGMTNECPNPRFRMTRQAAEPPRAAALHRPRVTRKREGAPIDPRRRSER